MPVFSLFSPLGFRWITLYQGNDWQVSIQMLMHYIAADDRETREMMPLTTLSSEIASAVW